MKLDTLPLYHYQKIKEKKGCIDCGRGTKYGVRKYGKHVPLCLNCASDRDKRQTNDRVLNR